MNLHMLAHAIYKLLHLHALTNDADCDPKLYHIREQQHRRGIPQQPNRSFARSDHAIHN